MSWHVPEDDLLAYARGELAAPALWSADAHLVSCDRCRRVLAEAGDPVALDAGWERLDAELDAPRAGLLESLLVRVGVAGHTARLLAAAPVLRRSWLGAVVAVLLLSVAAGHAVRGGSFPTLFLALAPLLPLAGVALSYGPALDPTYEMTVVAPMHGFRLLMIRTVAVLAVVLGLNGLATLALPAYGLRALAWLLPALALTATGLALT
ncbi:zf-HC2 domain-containing protein, partial [Streptomyces sp. NPDC006386]